MGYAQAAKCRTASDPCRRERDRFTVPGCANHAPDPGYFETEPASTIVAKAAEVTPVQTLKPAAPTKQPSQPVTPKSQPVEAQAEPKPAPTSPFGRPLADGEPERKWNVSQWID